MDNSSLNRLLVTHFCLPFIQRFLRSIVGPQSPSLTVVIPSLGKELHFGSKEDNNNEQGLGPVTLTINDPLRMCWRLLLDDKMGLGEAFMYGYWDANPTPTHLLNLLITAKKRTRNEIKKSGPKPRSVGKILAGWALGALRTLVAGINYRMHRLRANMIGQSAKNIEEHYDLGNEMFRLFLDKSMTYSCAVFQDLKAECTIEQLQEAQMRKIDNLLDLLELTADDHVLEIGCGWGAAAIRAVQRSGCKWTGITLSHEQLAWAQEKVAAAGLEGQIELRYEDYRLTKGKYSKILSVEMIEAVGQEFIPKYFEVINERLQDGGIAAIQAITCPDEQYERYCKSSDFIKKYIFPGGHMPSEGAMKAALPRDLKMIHKTPIGKHYAKTLDIWFGEWRTKEEELRALGLSRTFHRKWQYYFAMCSALFTHDHIDTLQLRLQKSL